MPRISDKPTLDGLEAKWDFAWDEQRIYTFEQPSERSQVYSVDTPPPTVSGSLHLGTVFGYVQFDAMARYQRMRGKHVFFPMGWDDNGLPTERRVQNHFKVRCDPSLPHGAMSQADATGLQRISRSAFISLCEELTQEDEKAFERVFRHVGISVDWSLTYATIDQKSRRTAQRGFLRNLKRGEAYATEAPTVWDVDFQTAVAQAEVEDRPLSGAYYRLGFAGGQSESVVIETTRPELLPACVALVVHPNDARWESLVGTTVRTPLFQVGVPVVAHALAEPDKGSGIAMICTFGDTTDVTWWRELALPLRPVIRRDGRLIENRPEWLPAKGLPAWDELAGLTVKAARLRIVDLLRESGDLLDEPRPIEHDVRFYEKGDRPLEIVTSRQWYIRNGARDARLTESLIEAGKAISWNPEFMRVRYEHWVRGLNTDWLISRQRYFGVPIPIWYRVGPDGAVVWDDVILADESLLPVDPQSEVPAGFEESQRGKPNGFVGDPDVMDTWATSSLTPQIACGWEEDPELFRSTFPMDLRPQGPEIIRTWLFSTILRSHQEHDSLPWKHVSINGWILDPDRKKMSKSKGNVVTPAALVNEHGADGLRYWACSAAPGVDTAIDAAQMRVGRRLATKMLNASRFVIGLGIESEDSGVTEPLDRSMVVQLAVVADEAGASFDAYQYQQALDRIESFFWRFCDDYLELVKIRAYSEAGGSARAALAIALSSLQRLLAPFLPFACEEAWSWWQEGSIHRSPWPTGDDLRAAAEPAMPMVLDVASSILRDIRKVKSAAQRGMRTPVTSLDVEGPTDLLAAFEAARVDILAAGVVESSATRVGDARQVRAVLGPTVDR